MSLKKVEDNDLSQNVARLHYSLVIIVSDPDIDGTFLDYSSLYPCLMSSFDLHSHLQEICNRKAKRYRPKRNRSLVDKFQPKNPKSYRSKNITAKNFKKRI